ncbi:hypothetical protein AMATHDRAFT_65415 [Amanita thiersii Skay4041]|uniref:Uncharacterized protein n=1 Tax=Amanita thiersii Skay4041 TaxID=703135 RepID=A0A2A9NJL7_9AGAR|nr:hypothetical protein AMATHDRAFT_65415 [Amanita thiersii Skay4041]
MPAKYSHIKKRTASGLLKKGATNGQLHTKETHAGRVPNPHLDRSITQAMSAVSQLERAIARILLLRFEHDIARLFSTRLYSIALVNLPSLVMRCITLAGPGWLAHNYDCDEIKDCFRAAISMDMRQAGERVATKSVLWSYTALRHFALSNNVPICTKRGLHSLRLLPYYPALKAHLDTLETLPPPTFSKPPHLGSLHDGQGALEDACELKYCRFNERGTRPPEWDDDWRRKMLYGYEKLSQTLWRVAREFDVRGYGNVLREKLTTKWCDCGCSTDHLGEVCERTVREEEAEHGVRVGKQREWDGRGSGVYGWETEEEEDLWEIDLDFGGLESNECDNGGHSDATISELMEWRFIRAEKEKEEGNIAFRMGDYLEAIKHYKVAHDIEPEIPHYQLNLAAAHLKLNNWIEAEQACTKALSQHKSGKGYYRRARARKMLNRADEAIKDLRALLKIQPSNIEAITELASMMPHIQLDEISPVPGCSSSVEPCTNSPSDYINVMLERLNISRPKRPQPPFPRTYADERKLKITMQSVSASDYGDLDKGPQRHVNAGQKHKGSIKDIGKVDAIPYPGWDRYVVDRAI